MVHLNVRAIAMFAVAAVSSQAIGMMIGDRSRATLVMIAGALLVAVDLAWRARQVAEKPGRRWLGAAAGGFVAFFPVWGIGLFGLVYGAMISMGYTD